jgi:carbamoyl-phosphate synthase large subunit
MIEAGEIDMIVNTPEGGDARRDGYAIRTAATSMDRPIITTIQQLGAAVHGIESIRTAPARVASLQEHAAGLDLAAGAEQALPERPEQMTSMTRSAASG